MSGSAPAGSFPTNEIEIIEFDIEEKLPSGEIGINYYGINVAKVREVIKLTEQIARTGKEHPVIEGVIDLRNEIIPVVNLPRWLEKFDPQFKYERIIISEFNQLRAGFLVSHVHRIHRVTAEKIEPPAALIGSGKREVITGITRVKGKLIMMIDFEKVLADIDPETAGDIDDLPEISPPHGRRKTVLIVDDSGLMLSGLKKAFTKSGYSVKSAHNGREALQQLKELAQTAARQNRPVTDYVDIITSDVEMPLMDGLTLLAKLKEDKQLKGIPVVIFSSMTNPVNIKKWEPLGAEDYLAKPELSLLIKRVNEITSTL